MQDLVSRLSEAAQNIPNLWCIFDLPAKEVELQELQKKSEDPALWDVPSEAQRTMKRLSDLRSEIDGWKSIQKLSPGNT